MRRALVAALFLAGCHEASAPTPPVVQTVVVPGGTVNAAAALSVALNCPVAQITWSVVEPNGGSVSSAGVYQAPPCGSFVAGTYHVRGEGCGRSGILPVTVAEDVLSVDLVCAVVQGTSCCARSLAVAPGTQIQFYAGVSYSCPGHVEYDPAPPPGVCP